MDLKKYLTKPKFIRTLPVAAVLFLVFCMSIQAGTALASSADVSSTAIVDDGVLPKPLLQMSANGTENQSMKYLLAEVNYVDDTLNLIDVNTSQVISTINVGYGPLSLMPRPGTMDAAVLLDDHDTQKIVIVNMTTKEIYANIFLMPADKGGIGIISDEGSVDHIFWRHDGKYLYVVTDTFLAVINARTYTVEKCFDVVGSRVAADMNPAGSAMLLFRKVKANTYLLDRLNTTSNNIEKTRLFNLSFDTTNIGPLRFSPNGTMAYTFIDDMGLTGWIGVEPNLIIINADTMEVQMVEHALPTVKSSSRTNRMDLEVSPDGNHLYMLYSSCMRLKLEWGEILTYNLVNRTCENTFFSDCREIGGITLSPDGSQIYVANYCDYWERTNTISIMNATTGEITGHFSVDYGPMDVKVVPLAKA